MNDDQTKNLKDPRSFEERVFARFDAIDARFNTIDARFDAIDERFEVVEARLEKLEARSYDTKPIWEQALRSIMELTVEMGEVKTKVGVIEIRVGVIEEKVGGIEERVGVIEERVGVIEERVGGIEQQIVQMRADYAGLHDELVETQRDFKKKLDRRIELVLTTLLDTRDGIRDADDRITQLESKLA